MSGVAITYGDITKGAKEGSDYVCHSVHNGGGYRNLFKQNGSYGCGYACPCELYQTVLDGTQEEFPKDATPLGLWSEALSGDDGVFTEPPVLIIDCGKNIACSGFTFTFDTNAKIYPKKLTVQWLRVEQTSSSSGGETVTTTVDEQNFYPDSPFYYCNNYVDSFNRVIVTFHSMSLPRNRLKLFGIDFGFGTTFYGEELRNVSVNQSIEPLSSEIAINTLNFTVDSKTDMEYSFQTGQQVTVYFDDRTIMTGFIKSHTRSGKRLWDVEAEDYIGLCDTCTFAGGMYKDANAGELFEDIFNAAGVPYEIGEEFYDVTLTGYIPYGTAREALMQVAFAASAVVDTSDGDVVKVFSLPEETTATIPLERILEGQSFEESEPVTTVTLDVHEYKEIDSGTVENEVVLYNAAEEGTGDEILIKFSEPYHDIWIDKGEILSVSVNHAVINAEKDCKLVGYGYEHTVNTFFIDNTALTENAAENIAEVQGAYLVSRRQRNAILQRCYDYLTRTTTTNLSIVEGRHIKYGENVKYGGGTKYGSGVKYGVQPDVITSDEPTYCGQKITAKTEYLGDVTGVIVSQSFNLNGKSIIKESVLK